MRTLTIRGVPEELHEKLKIRAKQNRRSLNQEVIAELSMNEGVEGIYGGLSKAEYFISLSKEIHGKLIKPLSPQEIAEGIRDGRR